MTPTLPHAPRRAAAALLTALALTPLAACGGDEASGAGDGLARLAPAASVFFLETTVKPDGDERRELDALVEKVAPGQDVDDLVRRALDGSDDLDYARDVEPWLGERAALAVTGAGTGERPDAAGLVETTDPEKALAAVRKQLKGRIAERSHEGVTYVVASEKQTAAGIVDETLVVGTEGALKAVVDASKGDGLDTNPEFERTTSAVDEDALSVLWADARRAVELARTVEGVDAEGLEAFREAVARRELGTVAAGLTASATAIELRGAAVTKDGGGQDEAAATLAALPSGSWIAMGLGDVGRSLTDGLDGLMGLTGPGFDVRSGFEQLERQTGIDVQRDLLAWMGQSGLFVRGTSLTDIGGALVVRSRDPAATSRALAKARELLSEAGGKALPLTGAGIDDGFSVRPGGAPFEVFAALAGDRFVLAVNRAALDAAIAPGDRLADDDAFEAAAEELGDGFKPTFFLDTPKVSGLIGLAASGEPGFAKVRPYLDRLGAIAAGGKRDGDLELQTVVIGVR